jgi:hypothetical protein
VRVIELETGAEATHVIPDLLADPARYFPVFGPAAGSRSHG